MVNTIKTLEFLFAYYKLQWSTIFEYKKSFFINSITMAINDVFLIFIWFIFFHQVESLNGWGFNELLIVASVLATAFGFFSLFSYGMRSLNDLVLNGELDFYLLKPKNPLLHVMVSKMNVSALGELLFGIVTFYFSGYLTIPSFFLYYFVCIIAAIVLTTTYLLISLPSFYLYKTDILFKNLDWGTLHFASYPSSIYSGAAKFLLYFVIPAYFISTLPSEILIQWNLFSLLYLVAFTISYAAIVYSLFLFNLNRYESGNTMSLRT